MLDDGLILVQPDGAIFAANTPAENLTFRQAYKLKTLNELKVQLFNKNIS